MLTDEDCDNICAFQLKLVGNISCCVFNCMCQSFWHKMTIDSEWVILHHLATLSGIQPINYDCCVNSCIAYTDDYSHHIQCPFCNESCYDTGEHTQQYFSYLPLIAHIQGFSRVQIWYICFHIGRTMSRSLASFKMSLTQSGITRYARLMLRLMASNRNTNSSLENMT
jgi:hypothetical protein